MEYSRNDPHPHLQVDDSDYERYLSSLISGDRLECFQIVQRYLHDRISLKVLYVHLFQRSLYRVGELWEFNRISVATEHMATSITEGIMNQLYPSIISPKRVGKKAIVASLENELHQVGGKMAADIFEMHGWDCFYLGASVPGEELIRFVGEKEPDVVGLSLSVYFHLEDLKRTLDLLRKEFNALPILVGGQAFRVGGKSVIEPYPKIFYVPSLDALEEWIEKPGR